MVSLFHLVEMTLEAALLVGSAVWLAPLLCSVSFRRRARARSHPTAAPGVLPKVTLLKPVYGLEKNLRENLRTACLQDYPDYQVLYSVQRENDPALPVLQEIQREFGPERVTVAVENAHVGPNGKINNLVGAMRHARHDVLVISDSDVRLKPDYLKAIVAPLADPDVGGVNTFFKASDAGPWYEQMELLTINADHFALAIVADAIHLVDFCFGASFAVRRDVLERIGGFEALGDYLVEDNEMGRRIAQTGAKIAAVPYVIDTTVDLQSPADWWQKQTYWDQNTRAAIPGLFAATLLLRIIPLGILLAMLRGWDAVGVGALALASGVRLASAAMVMGVAQNDRRSLRWLWLLPVKDVLSLFWFARAFLKRTVVWRGVKMALTRDGRLSALPPERVA